ncbi:MAG: 50S ribosomal protein L32 [Candidatus Taylorbacteria bacterium]|nr:50S ribosomal protein L32 [Candidatus Taylorbacteria bacterium]
MVVRMRANRSHRDNRRAHFALKNPRFSSCKDCGAPHLRHRVCSTCGKYKGIQVVNVHAKIEKKLKKSKEKAKEGKK